MTGFKITATKNFHKTLMFVTLAFMLVSLALIPFANVNSDMTKYLPDDSQMKHGLEILRHEFAADEIKEANMKVMIENLSTVQCDSLRAEFLKIKDIETVSYQKSEDGYYTLFSMQTPDSIDLASTTRTLENTFNEKLIIETVQDGVTPPIFVIAIAAVLVVVILLIMSQSWIEPFVFLTNVGIAVLINIGTNSLLPSVSVTTNYIGAILQLVLSLDFSIIMANRFRQEMNDECSVLEAINRAIKRATRPILSSALTTIVGLLMLCFMRLKIGMDMGIVLAKGVACSLICTFTVLPSLLMLFQKQIEQTQKKAFVVSTERLGNFATGHKVTVAVFGVLIFGATWYFSQKTNIFFSTKSESKIAKIFPTLNPFLILYDTNDEQEIIAVADSLQKDSSVRVIISYPTLLKRQFSATEAVDYIKNLSTQFSEYMPENANLDLVNNETMRLVYYMHNAKTDTVRITFPELMQFITTECIDNPLFTEYITDEMRSQISLMESMFGPTDESHTEATIASSTEENKPAIEIVDTPVAVKEKTDDLRHHNLTVSEAQNTISVIQFVRKLANTQPSEEANFLVRYTDTVRLKKQFSVGEMAEFMGSTPMQTKMIYSFYKNGKTMSPRTYVKFLLDDLFHRNALKRFVSDEQKKHLKVISNFMDIALKNKSLSPEELSPMLIAHGITSMTVERICEIAFPAKTVEQKLLLTTDTIQHKPTATITETLIQPEKKSESVSVSARKKTKEDLLAEYFMQKMESKKRLSATETTKIFNRLGQQISNNQTELLYTFYGYKNYYNDSLKLSTEDLLTYLADTLVNDKRLTPFFPQGASESISNAKKGLSQAVDMMRKKNHSLCVVLTTLPDEDASTYAFVDKLNQLGEKHLKSGYNLIGSGVMYNEMRNGFHSELSLVTILTILSIFIIIAIPFRSIVVPSILIAIVLSANWANVIFSGIVANGILYLAYLIVQSILMGATIDYGILFTNYYREYRKTMYKYEACKAAYKGSIRTIITSGTIMVVAPGIMALLVDDVAISSIVGCLAVGAFVAIVLILFLLPATLVALDRWTVYRALR